MTDENKRLDLFSNPTGIQNFSFGESLFNITIISLSLSSLFSNEIFLNNVLKYKNPSNLEALNCFFIFEGFHYPELYLTFTQNGILLAGGSNALRYSISPVKFRLSQIINVFEGNWYLDNVVASYYLKKDNLLIKNGKGITSINTTKPIPDMEEKISNYFKTKKETK